MQARRAFIQRALAATALTALVPWARVAAQDRFDQDALLEFETLGNVTLIHFSDLRGQLVPAYQRPQEFSVGVGDAQGMVPHLTGETFRIRYGVGGGTPMDYAFTHEDFGRLAQAYGPMGGIDRVATVVNAIRAERPDALLLDGGDTGAGPSVSLKLSGPDVGSVINALKPNATVVNVADRVGGLPYAALGQNVFDAQPEAAPAEFKPYEIFERGAVKIAVIGLSNPFANTINSDPPNAKIGNEHLQRLVDEVRANGAVLVVCLSQSGFDIDAAIAADVNGIDVILSGRSDYALPEPVLVGDTHIIASGAQGRFVSRIDLDVQDGKVIELGHKLIPIFSDLIAPDPTIAALVAKVRAPYVDDLNVEIGTADALLFRRGTVQSSWDDLIAEALLSDTDAQISLTPGFRWGSTILPGQKIFREDIFGVTAVPNPEVIRSEMTGAGLKRILETAADRVFNADPYHRTGEDMLRVGGLAFTLDVAKDQGQRINDMMLLPQETAIDPVKTYAVASWALTLPGSKGAPVWAVLERYIMKRGRVGGTASGRVTLVYPE